MFATVDHALAAYLESKRTAIQSPDPVADLRAGWDAHTGFALANPNSYRLMFGPGLKKEPLAVRESHELPASVVDRVARVGRLRVPKQVAVRTMMSANTGVAVALITRPAMYPDAAISAEVRDITFSGILTPQETTASDNAWPSALATISATVEADPPSDLTAAELGLSIEWLRRLAPRL